jgi:mannose-6-phosphate isomerase-like protein (cupin superfamily)
MSVFETKSLPVTPDHIAPDGMEVRELPALDGGGFAHFTLASGKTTRAVAHGRVEEIWYFLSGVGEMWRKQEAHEAIVPVGLGVSITIPVGTHFQLRSHGSKPLSAVAVTMPPWQGSQDADPVEGKWPATVGPTA